MRETQISTTTASTSPARTIPPRLLVWACLLVSTLLATQPGSAQSTTLTLDSVLCAVRHHYPTYAERPLTQEIGKNLRQALWYAYIPQLSLEGTVHYQSTVPAMELKLKEEPKGSKPFPSDDLMRKVMGRIEMPQVPKLQYDTYAQVSQLLWDGGRLKAAAGQIEANTTLQLAQQKQQLEQVEEGVEELYFGLLMLDAQIRVQQILLDELDRQQQRVHNALKNGVGAQNDADEVALEVLKAGQTMKVLKDNRRALLQALSIYMGNPLDENTVATPPTPPLTPTQATTPDRQRFAPNKSTHQILDTQIDLANAKYRSALSEGLPTLGLFARGGYGRPGLNLLSAKPQPYLIYGAKFSWNIGGLYTIGKQKKVREQTCRLTELKREAFETATKAKIAEQQNEVTQYQTLIRNDEEVLRLRKNISDRAEIQVREGTITTTERLRQLSLLAVAQQTHETHQIQLLRALYKIKHTLGN